MVLGSMPGPFQKEAVSLSKMLTLTSHFSLARPLRTLVVLGELTAMFEP